MLRSGLHPLRLHPPARSRSFSRCTHILHIPGRLRASRCAARSRRGAAVLAAVMSMEVQAALAQQAMQGAAAGGGAPDPTAADDQCDERRTYGGLDATDRPQILEHVHKPLALTVYDTRWVPLSARFVVLGSHAR